MKQRKKRSRKPRAHDAPLAAWLDHAESLFRDAADHPGVCPDIHGRALYSLKCIAEIRALKLADNSPEARAVLCAYIIGFNWRRCEYPLTTAETDDHWRKQAHMELVRRKITLARQRRNEAIRRLKADHPDWSAAKIQKHPLLVKHFPEVRDLTDRQVRAILARK